MVVDLVVVLMVASVVEVVVGFSEVTSAEVIIAEFEGSFVVSTVGAQINAINTINITAITFHLVFTYFFGYLPPKMRFAINTASKL